MESRTSYNTKCFPVGSIVYYIKKQGCKWSVDFARVLENYSREIYAERLVPLDCREVEGVPFKEFNTPTRWMKLPKGWTYNTQLFEVTNNEETLNRLKNYKFDLKDPENIREAYRKGLLIKAGEYDDCYLAAEIDCHFGWRIVRKYDNKKYGSSVISIDWKDVYKTYEEAENEIQKHDAELKRIANLSDYDWSVEQIDKTLDTWAAIRSISDEEKKRYRDWILDRDHVEDIEVRISGGCIQWKYWKSRRWAEIVL